MVRALTPAAARLAPAAARAAAAFITAAAARQPMLAESMLLPAQLSKVATAASSSGSEGKGSSMLDSLWECLGEAGEMRVRDPRMLAAAVGALEAVWVGGQLLQGAVATLRSQPTLVSRLEACLPLTSSGGSGVVIARRGEGGADDVVADPDVEADIHGGGGGEEDEAEAFRFAAEASALNVLACEVASCARGPGPREDSAIARVVAGWCEVPAGGAGGTSDESALLLWLRRWTAARHQPGVFAAARSHAQAVVLLAAAAVERAAAGRATSSPHGSWDGASAAATHGGTGAGAAPLCDATLEEGSAAAGSALLSHAAAADLLAGGAPRAAVLEAAAAAAAAHASGAPPRASNDPVGRLLEASRHLRLERVVLAPPPPGPLPGIAGGAEYGGDFLYNATWVEAATGGARPAAAARRAEGSGSGGGGDRNLESDEGGDAAWGAPDGPLSRPGHAAAASLRAAGRAASRASAQLSTLTAALGLLTVAAGPMSPDHSEDDDDSTEPPSSSTACGCGMLSSWPTSERAAAVHVVVAALEAALVAADEEGSDHAAAFAAELADVLALLVRLWARAVAARGARRVGLSSVGATGGGAGGGFSSKLNLVATTALTAGAAAVEDEPGGGSASGGGGGSRLDVFSVAEEVAALVASALSHRPRDSGGSGVGGAVNNITRPLLAAALDAVRGWRRQAEDASPSSSSSASPASWGGGRVGDVLRDANALGTRLWPLLPMLCHAGSTPGGGADAVLALAVTREMAAGLLPMPALIAAVQGRAFLPPLNPPPPPQALAAVAAGRGVSRALDLGLSSLVTLPFTHLGDAPAMALRPFLELNASASDAWADRSRSWAVGGGGGDGVLDGEWPEDGFGDESGNGFGKENVFPGVGDGGPKARARIIRRP